MAKCPQPTLQWSTMMTLIPMLLEDTMVVVEILMKFDYMFTRYTDPNMFPTNTMGFRVTLVDNMSLCSQG